MPRPKRWCHISQDINFDPEFERLCKEFGLGGVRFFLQVMSILDKTENHWALHKDFDLNVLARCCGTKPRIILGSYQLLIDMNWISVGVNEGLNQFIYARNYTKYRGNRVHENDMTKQVSCSPPYLPLPLKERDKAKVSNSVQKKETLDAFEEFWESFPARNGKKLGKPETQVLFLELTKENQSLAIQAAKNYSESERVKDGIGIRDPKRFLKNGKGSQPWHDWIEPEVSQNGKGELKLCSSRIEVEGNLKTCKRPATKMVGKSFICDGCYDRYQKKQESVQQKGDASAN